MGVPNWVHQTLWTGDNLRIMRGMNSASVDLMYLDPPFNSKVNYAAPVACEATGAAFKDTWALSDVDVEWINLMESKYPAMHRVLLAAMSSSDKSYLAYLAVRLLEMKRLLKPTGSIYLHCDPTMSHYLKLLMDALFGKKNFRNEIVWGYAKWSNAVKHFQRNHDILLFYAQEGYTFRHERAVSKYLEKNTDRGYHTNKINGIKQLIVYNREKAAQKVAAGDYDKIVHRDSVQEGVPLGDAWHDIGILNSQAKERVGYPTQKPLALLRRVVSASSREGDMVLDPFCGCATTCIAAEMKGRQWAGIDISPKASDLVRLRMEREVGLFFKGVVRKDIPRRTDLGQLPKYNSPANKQQLYGVQGGDCAGCGMHFNVQHLEVDHIISRRNGGTDHLENLQLLCGSCNRVKGSRGMEYLRVKLNL